MYTVGQMDHFLGMSRDTLKFYEEKGLVKPQKDQENGYSKYNEQIYYLVWGSNDNEKGTKFKKTSSKLYPIDEYYFYTTFSVDGNDHDVRIANSSIRYDAMYCLMVFNICIFNII